MSPLKAPAHADPDPRFAVVGFSGIVDPDGRGHYPLSDAHLRPPPEPYWDRQVRVVMPAGPSAQGAALT